MILKRYWQSAPPLLSKATGGGTCRVALWHLLSGGLDIGSPIAVRTHPHSTLASVVVLVSAEAPERRGASCTTPNQTLLELGSRARNSAHVFCCWLNGGRQFPQAVQALFAGDRQ